MKRALLFFISAVCALNSSAQIEDGYYRVQNVAQLRYISLVDNRGSVNMSTTDADLGALRTVMGFERVVSDPGSIVYARKITYGYDLQAQGTGSYSIVGYELSVGTGRTGYTAYASANGMTKYLADEKIPQMYLDDPDFFMDEMIYGSVVTNSATTREWYVKAVDPTTDCYFGITPDVTAGGSYYKSFYAAFPFTFYSSGMNAYCVSTVDEKKAAVVINELTSGVHASTPVLIKCSSTDAAKNKLNIGASTSGPVVGNQLKGVYFCNDVTYKTHRNVVDYDAATMRVLGTAPDGSLAFVKSSTLKYIPANTAYISVSSTAPDVLKVYTQSEYDALPDGTKGDLNNDGVVDTKDLDLIVKMILKTEAKTDAADVNKDGSVDVQDLGEIVKIILKK